VDRKLNISLENISVTYDNHSDPALRHVTLQLKRGEFVAVIGSSGSGKSTLLRCINLLVRPTSGRITWNGMELTKMSEKELRGVRTKIGMIFQQFQLVPRLNVITNVLLGTLGSRSSWKNWLGYFSNEERKLALQLLEQVGLEQFSRKRVENLSGGQQQRVAIARLMMQNPRILLADEPVSSLDPVIARSIMEILHKIHKRNGLITVINLHEILLAKQYATRIIGLSHGKVVFDGSPEDVTPEVQHLIYQDLPINQSELPNSFLFATSLKSIELPTTANELTAIANEANTGLNSPIIAKGIPIPLKKKA
jgi:phosphonate transport system ATP-binding protein